jgi:undecaprenyl-phosphate galactose phosphotransferase
MSSSTSERSLGPDILDMPTRLVGRRAGPAICAFSLLVADVVAALLAASPAIGVRQEAAFAAPGLGVFYKDAAAVAILALFAGIILCLALRGRYSARLPFWSELRLLLSTAGLTAMGLVAAALAFGELVASAPTIAALLLFPIIATIANRTVKQLLLRSGLWTLNLLLVGEAPELGAVEAALHSAPSLGYRVVRRIDPASVLADDAGARLRPLMERYGARRVVVALGLGHPLRRQVIDSGLGERIDFVVAPDIAGIGDPSADAASFLSYDAILMFVRDERSRLVARAVKAAFDVTVATAILVATSPLFLLVAIANMFDGGPMFFAHRRLGLGGRSFYCLKFRTMRVDGDRMLADLLARDPEARREWDATQKLRRDPRVTRIGRILRATSIDELPQLVNVIRREMSLVGPRPIVQKEVAFYGEDIVHYYSARPGLTGLWQVSGRSNTSYTRRVKLDVWYVNNWTIWNDIAVLLKTIPAVLAREGAH